MKKEKCKDILPKGFFSRKNKPTQNSLISYFIYLTFCPKDWDHKKTGKCNPEAIERVRSFFGVNYGFDCMLYWGINFACKNSKTSDGRYKAMALAYHDALGMIGKGYLYSNMKPV